VSVFRYTGTPRANSQGPCRCVCCAQQVQQHQPSWCVRVHWYTMSKQSGASPRTPRRATWSSLQMSDEMLHCISGRGERDEEGY
jgi:hypothetical protein